MRFPKGPRVRVTVKRETILRAVQSNSSKCWIAESIKEQVPQATAVAVDLSTTRFTDPERGLRYVYLTPYAAQLALLAFDEGNPPDPFAFTLKNAHVTRSGAAPQIGVDPKHDTKRTRENAKRRKNRAAAVQQKVSGAATLLSAVRRVGGKRPPQLRMLRKFGVRAFRGASQKRLETELLERATRPE